MKAFATWLVEEIAKRGWSQAEFARRAGMSAASVSRVLSGEHNAGEDFIAGTARAFGVPLESVMRLAGKLPELGDVLPEAREWSARLLGLTPARRAAAVAAIANILDLADNRAAPSERASPRDPVDPPDRADPVDQGDPGIRSPRRARRGRSSGG
jgi:transcriptional regulator with XRE-family HTH domain